MAEQKSYKPTKQRLEKARKEGNVKKSQLLTQSLAFTASCLTILQLMRFSWVRIGILLKCTCISGVLDTGILLKMAGRLVVEAVGCCLLSGALLSVISDTAQIGLRFEMAIIAPRAERFSLAAGLKRIGTGLNQIWLKIIYLTCLGTVLYLFFQKVVGSLPLHYLGGQRGESYNFYGIGKQFFFSACAVLITIGSLDWFFQHRKFNKELSMSGDEIKRESRELEGDPQLKSFRQSLHREMVLQDIRGRVRKARVIIVEKA